MGRKQRASEAWGGRKAGRDPGCGAGTTCSVCSVCPQPARGAASQRGVGGEKGGQGSGVRRGDDLLRMHLVPAACSRGRTRGCILVVWAIAMLQLGTLNGAAANANALRPGLRLRGGSSMGRGAGAFSDASRGVADEDEFFRKFGSGPGSMDLSSSRFEIRPDSFNDTDSLLDGAGMWDYPEEYRLLGEHISPRVGHRVRTSPYLRRFWAEYNFTDYQDGWDHQSDRLGTIIGVADDGRSCEVKWDGGDGQKETIDWYATGYLTNYFLSLAPDSLQPEFPEDGTDERIAQLEEELRKLRGTRGFDDEDDVL